MESTRLVRLAALLLALSLLSVALFALSVSFHGASCPKEGGLFSCLALVRPSLSRLGPFSVTNVLVLGASLELLCALLLQKKSASPRFSRDVAFFSALGAGFALGIQPLSFLVTKKLCLLCELALLSQLLLAVSFAALTKESRRALLGCFLLAFAATASFALREGGARAQEDERRRAFLRGVERKGARLVILERAGCPYCEALLLDVLASSEVAPLVSQTGLARQEAAEGEGAPVLIARDGEGREVARASGFTSDLSAYSSVLEAAKK